MQWIGAIILVFSGSGEAAALECASKLDVKSSVSSIIECLQAQEKEIARLGPGEKGQAGERGEPGPPGERGDKGDTGSGAIHKISYATAQGPNDGTDDGRIVSRTLRFHKDQGDTDIRILYSDNLRVRGAGKACRWTINVNGTDCGDQKIYSDRYDASTNANLHGTSTVLGYCKGLGIGWHTIRVWVSEVPHNENAYADADCYTGWNNALWTLEATELFGTSE